MKRPEITVLLSRFLELKTLWRKGRVYLLPSAPNLVEPPKHRAICRGRPTFILWSTYNRRPTTHAYGHHLVGAAIAKYAGAPQRSLRRAGLSRA